MSHLPLRRPVLGLIAVAAIASVAGQAPAQPDQPPSRVTAPSPFTGRWELDLTRMPSTYGPPPKRVVYGLQDIGGGKRRLTVDITGQDDSVRHMAVSFRTDGTTARSEGETSEADSAAIMTPAPDVLILNLARAKMPGSVRVYMVSANGNEMIESAAALDTQGEPFVRNFHYTRLR